MDGADALFSEGFQGEDQTNYTSEHSDSAPDVLKTLGERWQLGEDQVAKSRYAVQLLNDSRVDAGQMKLILSQKFRAPDADQIKTYESSPWYARAVMDATTMLPAIKDTIQEGLLGGAGGAAIGAGVGSVLPGLGTAAGGVAGLKQGYEIGSLHSIWEQSAGGMASDLLDAGVEDKDLIRNVSYALGTVNAGLERIGLHGFGKLAGRALTGAEYRFLSTLFKEQAFTRVQTGMAARLGIEYAKTTLGEATEEASQQVNTELGKVIAALAERKAPDAYTNWDTAYKNIQDSFFQALGASAVLGVGTAAAGHAAGSALGAAKKAGKLALPEELRNSSPAEILAKVRMHLEEQPYGFEETPETYEIKETPEGGTTIVAGVKKKSAPNVDHELRTALDTIFGPEIIPQEPETPLPVVEEGDRVIERQVYKGPVAPETFRGRVNQIAADIRNLVKIENQLMRRADQISRDNGPKRRHDAVLKKLDTVRQTMESLSHEKELLESGAVPIDTTGAEAVRFSTRGFEQILNRMQSRTTKALEKLSLTFERREAKAETRHGKELSRADKVARKDQAEIIRQWQKRFSEVIDLSTDDKELRTRAKSLSLAAVTPRQIKSATKAALLLIKKEVPKREAAKAQTLRENIIGKIQKELGRVKEKTSGGYPTAPIGEELINFARTVEQLLSTPTAPDEFIEAFGEKYENELKEGDLDSIPLNPLLAYEAANQVNEFNRNPENGQALLENLRVIFHEGRAEITARREESRNQKDALLLAAEKSFGPLEEQSKSPSPLNNLVSTFLTWPDLLRFLTPEDEGHEIARLLDTHEPKRNFLTNKELVAQAMFKSINDAVGEAGVSIPDLTQWLNDSVTQKFHFNFKQPDGSDGSMILTRAQARDAWMKIQDPTLHDSLRNGNKASLAGDPGTDGKSFEEVLDQFLTDGDKAIATGLFKFYEQYHADLSPAYKAKYGVSLPFRDNFSPVSRSGAEVEVGKPLSSFLFSSVLPKSARTRKKNVELGVKFQNDLDLARQYSDAWEHFRSHDDLITRLKTVFGNGKIREHVGNRFGFGTMKVIDHYIENFVRNQTRRSGPDSGFWSALQADISSHALGFNTVNAFAVQVSSGVSLWADYSPTELASEVSSFVSKYAETNKVFDESPVFRARRQEGVSEELNAALHKNGFMAQTLQYLTGFEPGDSDFTALAKIQHLMYQSISMGDAASVRLFGGLAYHVELARGATPEEALRTIENKVENTQQGKTADQVPYVLSANPLVYTLFGMFKNQNLQLFGHSLIATRDFLNDPTPKKFLELGYRLGAYWFIPGLLVGLIRSAPRLVAPPGEDPERDRETAYEVFSSALLGPASGLPLFGDVIEALWFSAAKPLFGADKSQYQAFMGKNSLYQLLVSNPAEAFKAWDAVLTKPSSHGFSAEKPGAQAEKSLKAGVKTARAVSGLVGAPRIATDTPFGVFQSVKNGDYLGAAFALGGWSYSGVKARQPKPRGSRYGFQDNQTHEQSLFDQFAAGFLSHSPAPAPPAKSAEDEFAAGFLGEP